MNKEIVGVIQGSIKTVTFHKPPKNLSKVGYILGLRVDPIHRRKGIGLRLVHQMEEWFNSNQVDYSYMATEKGNEASVNLFINKLGYVKFRTPAILVHPAVMESPPRWQQQRRRSMMEKKKKNIIEIVKLKVEEAEFLYRNYMMNSTEFFPNDMDKILRNKLSLGTWVAYNRNNDLSGEFFGPDGMVPKNWAMISVWNSGEIFKLRIGKGNNKPPFSCILYSKSSRIINKAFPCFKNRASSSAILLPDDFLSSNSNSSSSSNPFGFYFMYGLYRDGPFSGKLIRALCKFIHNLAAQDKDCKAVVTEVGGFDPIKLHIPHWKLLSCTEDLWCIKALKQDERKTLFEFTKNTTIRTLFVDPREV